MLGWRKRAPLRDPGLRAVGPDLLTLASGLALMLVWAGFVEAFFSQFHEPRFALLAQDCVRFARAAPSFYLPRPLQSDYMPMLAARTNTLRVQTRKALPLSLFLASPVTRFLACSIDLGCIAVLTSTFGYFSDF